MSHRIYLPSEKGIAKPLIVFFALAFGPLLASGKDHLLGFIELDESFIMQITQACWDGIKM